MHSYVHPIYILIPSENLMHLWLSARCCGFYICITKNIFCLCLEVTYEISALQKDLDQLVLLTILPINLLY